MCIFSERCQLCRVIRRLPMDATHMWMITKSYTIDWGRKTDELPWYLWSIFYGTCTAKISAKTSFEIGTTKNLYYEEHQYTNFPRGCGDGWSGNTVSEFQDIFIRWYLNMKLEQLTYERMLIYFYIFYDQFVMPWHVFFTPITWSCCAF